MRKIISAFLSLCILTSVCAADLEATNVESGVFTLEEAIEYAIKNNSYLIDMEKNTDTQEELYDDAKTEYRKWKNQTKNGGYSFEESIEYLNCWGYSLELAKLQYESFLSNKNAAKFQVEYSVKSMIYNIFELEDSISLLEKTIEKQENDVKIAEVKYRLNMITETELDSAKTTLDSSKLQLESIKQSLASVKISIKQLMGYDVLKEISFEKPEYEVEELEIEDLESTINSSLETNVSALSSKIQYKQKENNYILATKTSFFSKDEKKDAKKDYSDAEFRLNNEINSIKENMVILYNQVKEKEKETDIAKEELDSADSQFEQAKTMYEVGLISKNTYDGYELSFINAENTYKSKIKEEILLKNRWEIAISVGDIIAK